MKVSFAFAILNESNRLHKCLKSIRSQNYPQDLIEIVIADGGSIDDSISIASSYGAFVINNKDRLAEPGGVLAHSFATGDIKIFFAADNVLPHTEWVSNLVNVFSSNHNIIGVYTHIIPDDYDFALNKYYSELHVEPFTYAIYGNAANPRFYGNHYDQHPSIGPYKYYIFDINKHPLLAFAQGFAVKSTYQRPLDTVMDDVEPVMRMIEDGAVFVYGPNLGIYHYHLSTFKNYISKFKTRIDNTLLNSNFGVNSRNDRFTILRKAKKYLFVISGILIFPPLIEAIYLVFERKKIYMFYHVPASIILAYLILFRCINNFYKKII